MKKILVLGADRRLRPSISAFWNTLVVFSPGFEETPEEWGETIKMREEAWGGGGQLTGRKERGVRWERDW